MRRPTTRVKLPEGTDRNMCPPERRPARPPERRQGDQQQHSRQQGEYRGGPVASPMSAEQRSLLGQVREIERTHQHIGDCIACGDWDGAQARLNKIIKRYRSIQGQVCGITGNPILPNGGQR